MAHGTIIAGASKGAAETRLISVYCSNTASGALTKKKVVGLRFTNTVHVSTLIQGFGAAVDYTIAVTGSVVCGVLAGGKSSDTTFADGTWAQCITRGPVSSVYCSGTITAGDMLYPSATLDGYGYSSATVLAPESYIGYPLEAIADNSTDSLHIYVHTLMA